jgi:hypothetical protein
MPSTERRPRRIDIKLPPSGGGTTAQAATAEPVPPSIPTPPSPSGLVVVSTHLLYSAVSPGAAAVLSWYAPAGLTPDSYVVQWALDSGFTTPTTRPTSGAATTAGVDGLPVATVVYFRVAAVVRGVQGNWSNTASDTTPADTTAPAAPTSFGYVWSGLTGDLTITWTNPTSANFRDVRVRIYASNGGTLLREVYAAGGLYVWTRGQHYSDTSNVPDPAVYVTLTARSWGGVFSATDLTGSPTLAVPAAPAGLTTSWAADDGTAGPDLLVTWTRADVADYELTLNSTARRTGGAARYLLTFAQNQAENAGTADPSIAVSLKAVDALGQQSAASALTATNAAPPAAMLGAVFAGTSTVGLTITPSTAKDLLDYQVRVYKSAVLVDTVYTPDARPTVTIEDGSGSYTFDVAARDMFLQVGTASATSAAVALIDWDEFVTNLRAGLIYTDSIGTASASLVGLKDGDRTTNVISYASGTTWKWTQGDWGWEITHRNQEFVTADSNVQVYIATSLNGSTWTYYYGGTASGGAWTAASSTATEATAQAGAVTFAAGTWKISLPAPVRARYIRIHHRRTDSAYILREWFPASYFSATHIESESLTSREIVVGSLTGDRLVATAIDGFVITGATIQTAASGERVVLDSTGLKTYDSAGIVQVEATTATDGRLTAGAGNVTLDVEGMRVVAGSLTSPFDYPSGYNQAITWTQGGTEVIWVNGSIANSRPSLTLFADGVTGYGGGIYLLADPPPGVALDYQASIAIQASTSAAAGDGIISMVATRVSVDGYLDLEEVTLASPAANTARVLAYDSGGNTHAGFRFSTGGGFFVRQDGVPIFGPTAGTSGSSAGSTGEYLVININGVARKLLIYAT